MKHALCAVWKVVGRPYTSNAGKDDRLAKDRLNNPQNIVGFFVSCSVSKVDTPSSVDPVVADGLGPTMNLGSCGGCHLHPALGGTSLPVNPQIAFVNKKGAANTAPAWNQADIRAPALIRGRLPDLAE